MWLRLMILTKRDCVDQWKPVVAMLLVDFTLAVVNILFKKALTQGMNHLLIITYRQSIAAIFLTPIACFWERNCWDNLTGGLVCGLFFSALLGATLTQYFFLVGLKYTSATYTCAFINVVPVITFALALPFRQEILNLRKRSGRVKLLGTLVCVGGALVLILYKGMAVINAPKSADAMLGKLEQHGTENWAIGSIFLSVGSLMWASWFIIQAQIGKYFPFQYSSIAIMSFFGAIQSAILCITIDRNMSSWIPKGTLQITSVAYSGIVGSGVCYVIMSWCVKQRGPVFTSAFGPFIQIFVAIFDVFLLHEQINLGSILGSIIVIVGMYILLWGKSNEADFDKNMPADEGRDIGDCNHTLPITKPVSVISTSAEQNNPQKLKIPYISG